MLQRMARSRRKQSAEWKTVFADLVCGMGFASRTRKQSLGLCSDAERNYDHRTWTEGLSRRFSQGDRQARTSIPGPRRCESRWCVVATTHLPHGNGQRDTDAGTPDPCLPQLVGCHLGKGLAGLQMLKHSHCTNGQLPVHPGRHPGDTGTHVHAEGAAPESSKHLIHNNQQAETAPETSTRGTECGRVHAVEHSGHGEPDSCCNTGGMQEHSAFLRSVSRPLYGSVCEMS